MIVQKAEEVISAAIMSSERLSPKSAYAFGKKISVKRLDGRLDLRQGRDMASMARVPARMWTNHQAMGLASRDATPVVKINTKGGRSS
jgi:hypothetical protein